MGRSKRGGVEPTHEWELLLPLFEWPEQERYEEIRPLVLFDVPVAERAAEVGQAREAAAFGQAPHRGPQGRVPALQP